MTTNRTRTELRQEAVAILTEAARQRSPGGQPQDLADFVAHVLAATAANLGGCEILLDGRPGSWEAHQIRQLINGTMTDDPSVWQRYRTEPVTVMLNVAELIEDGTHHPGLLGLDDALAVLEARVDAGDLLEVEIAAQSALLAERYHEAFQQYADRFAGAVRTNAESMDLGAGVDVTIDHNPQSRWWGDTAVHNSDLAADPLVASLWQRAHDSTPLPNVDLAPRPHQTEGG